MAEEKEVQDIALTHMPNGNHKTFIKQQVSLIETDEAVAEEFEPQLTPLKNAWNEENRVMEKISFSELTKRIADADNDRDTLYEMFNRIWKAFLNFTETDKREAAEKIQRYDRVNKVNVGQQYDRETGNLSNFIEDMHQYCAAEVELLGLTPVLNKMEEKNNLVNQLLMERNEEYVDNKHIAVLEARRITDAAYIRLIKFINASALLNGVEKYSRVIDLLNQNIERTKLEVFKKKGQAGVNGGATPDGDGSSTEEGGGSTEEGGSTSEGEGSSTEEGGSSTEEGGNQTGGSTGSGSNQDWDV